MSAAALVDEGRVAPVSKLPTQRGLPSPEVRRLAFRFLLPTGPGPFRRAVLVGASEPLLRAARDAHLADEVLSTLPADASADLVAVLSDRSATMRLADDVVGSLASDGVVWWETDRRRSSCRLTTPRRISKQLAARGLAVDDTYLLRPEPSRSEWYVPLRHPHALRWFVDGLYVPGTTRQLITEAFFRSSTQLRPRAIEAMTPWHAVIARRPGCLSSDAGGLFRHQVGSTVDHLALISHGGDRTVLLGFAETERHPSVIAKVANVPAARATLVAEFHATNAVREHLGERLSATIPRATALLDGHVPALVESVVPGRSLARSLSLPHRGFDAKADDLHAVIRWIGDVHLAAVDADGTMDGAVLGEIDDQLSEYVCRFTPPDHERRMLDRTMAAARDLVGCHLPRVWEHGDFTPWNVLIEGYEVNVIDWEVARVGFPFCDVLRMADQWHAAMLGMQTPHDRAIARRWIIHPPASPSRATSVVRDAIDGYAVRLGLPVQLEGVLHVVCLAALALRQDDRRRRAGHPPGDTTFNIPAVQLEHLARCASSEEGAQP